MVDEKKMEAKVNKLMDLYDLNCGGPFHRIAASAKYLGVSKAQLDVMVDTGLLPKPIKISKRASGLPQPWLDTYINSRIKMSVEESE